MKHSGLPNWMSYIQRTFLLTFLILAEAYLLGYLMTLGWVKNIEDPAGWGWFHAIGVGLFFSAGAACAGIALQCSLKAAFCFQNKQIPMALFNLVGLFGFCGAELWASLSERSANLAPSPADNAVLSWLGITNGSFSVSVVVVAFLLPFASLYYGFSQMNQQEETVEELAMRLEKDRIRAIEMGKIGAIKAANRRKIVQAYTQDEQPVIPEIAPALAQVNQEEEPAQTTVLTTSEPPALKLKQRGKWWDAPSYQGYLVWAYNRAITPDKALEQVQSIGGGMRASELKGHPYIAGVIKLKNEAKRLYGEAQGPALVGGLSPEMAE